MEREMVDRERERNASESKANLTVGYFNTHSNIYWVAFEYRKYCEYFSCAQHKVVCCEIDDRRIHVHTKTSRY